MSRHLPWSQLVLAGAAALALTVPASAARFKFARIYIEYNDSANDLGFHVTLDAEDWTSVEIADPAGRTIFEVEGRGGYEELGMTELFFEGAEPNLDDFPLEDLLALFPAGRYRFTGVTVGGGRLSSTATLSHAVPDGPVVSADVDGSSVVLRWEPVTGAPAGFPVQSVTISAYQVIVGSFQVTVPASTTQVTVPPEYVDSLPRGAQPFEVLAIEASGNQSITEGTFEKD